MHCQWSIIQHCRPLWSDVIQYLIWYDGKLLPAHLPKKIPTNHNCEPIEDITSPNMVPMCPAGTKVDHIYYPIESVRENACLWEDTCSCIDRNVYTSREVFNGCPSTVSLYRCISYVSRSIININTEFFKTWIKHNWIML